MDRKVVITGRGLVTPLGNGLAANLQALREGKSGIVFMQEWADMGLDSLVAGAADREVECPMFTPKNLRFMSPNSRYAVAAAYEAFQDAGMEPENLPDHKIAIINGCAGSAYAVVYENMRRFEEHGRRVRAASPFAVPRIMPSSAVANLSLLFKTTGESLDISCACTSSAQAIINATRLIKCGEYDMVVAGGSEELSWGQALGFNTMRALSKGYNDTPWRASRPFDKNRDGFVLADGAGMLILESEEHALRRGVPPKAVVSGYYANSNALDMVVPSAESTAEVMGNAIKRAGLTPADIAYVNTHGTSTPVGDPIELNGIKMVFGEDSRVAVNSTKSLTGHMIGAAGAVEAIFSMLMMENSFICKSANIEEIDPEAAWANIPREKVDISFDHFLSNSFGFGGSNASLVISKYKA
ncbi:MAG: beta-ketoacyl-[acyl-carrier-protein] synthase family protein [Lentisphaeria bacterium]|nr:beta-ketoacyl-[acyl-carrier-protein] synthase family protein [Lentisphaeria bacterium]